MRVAAVVNPAAAGGRAAQAWPIAEAALVAHFGAIETRWTQRADQASDLALALAGEGFDIVVACGGDGTISEVADGLLRCGDATGRRVKLGVAPVGTGSDFARTMGFCDDIGANVARIVRNAWRAIDVGRVEFVADNGAPRVRHFINIASLGVSGPTDRAVNSAKAKGALGGKLVFLLHTLRVFLGYRFQHVRIRLDDQAPVEARIALVAVANGRFFGGGMMLAPQAATDDGLFDIVVLRPKGKFEMFRDLRLVYSGAHAALPSVTIQHCAQAHVEPLDDNPANFALLDIDGESPGRIPATFRIRRRALDIQA